jgi:5-methyltetrahydrofolate--homocysteine methyltransferase
MSWLDRLSTGRVLLMDGAMGTEMLRAGLGTGQCGAAWNLTRADVVLGIHRAYRSAGADVLLTNTFQANPLHLAQHGLQDRLDEINEAALRLARLAAGPRGVVLADIGPILERIGGEEFRDRRLLRAVLRSLADGDGILLETCSSPRALEAVDYIRHRVEDVEIPVLLSLTYLRDASGKVTTFSGHTPESFARNAYRHGVSALGVNCGRDIGMDEIIAIVRRYRSETDVPLFARPNAGSGSRQHTPDEMAARVPELLDAGVCMVGGCCGTTAEHIAAFGAVVQDWNRSHGAPDPLCV